MRQCYNHLKGPILDEMDNCYQAEIGCGVPERSPENKHHACQADGEAMKEGFKNAAIAVGEKHAECERSIAQQNPAAEQEELCKSYKACVECYAELFQEYTQNGICGPEGTPDTPDTPLPG